MSAYEEGAESGSSRDRIVAFIIESTEQRGFPPTVREITERLGWRSTSTTHSHLLRLLREGRIRHVPGSARTIQVVR